MATDLIDDVATFLFESGLLGEINRVVLHPRGLALSVLHDTTYGPEGKTTSVLLGPVQRTDDPEGWDFDADGLLAIQRKLEAAGLLHPLPRREAALGFVVQPLPPAPAPPPCMHRHPDGSDARAPGAVEVSWQCTLCGATDLD